MGEVCDVVARSRLGVDAERPGRLPGAARGVDDEVGLSTAERRRRGKGLGGEGQLGSVSVLRGRLQPSAGDHPVDSGGEGVGEQGLVEAGTRHVVRVGGHGRSEAREAEAELVRWRPDKGDARFEEAEGRRRLLDAEALEDRDHRGHQGFPDQQLRAVAVVEERHVGAAASEEGGEGGSAGAGADDGHPQDGWLAGSGGAIRAGAHRPPYGRSTGTGAPVRLRILPPGVLGTAFTTVNSTGTLYGERARAQCALSASRSRSEESRTT